MKTDADAEFKIRLLRAAPTFRHAGEDDLTELARVGKVSAFPAGKTLQRLEQDGAQIFVLQSGVAAELLIEPGVEDAILVGLHGPGAMVGVVGCALGLRVQGGSEGVGRATTNAVVLGIFMIIVVDAVFVTMQRLVLG